MSELDFHFTETGDPQGMPVLLLHAFPYHSGMWDAQRAALVAGPATATANATGTGARARVLTVDTRGLGRSTLSRSAFMFEHLVDDLLLLLDHAAVTRAVIAGVSMGGYLALRLAERAPERVAGLVLSDTQSASDGDQAKLARAEAVRSVRRDGIDAFAEAQLTRQLSPTTLETKPELAARLRAMILDSSPAGIEDALVALATRTDTTASLGRIAVPTAVLVGEHDTITPEAAARALHATIPGASLHVLPDAGHMANVEAAEAWNEVLLGLLARVRAAD